MTLTLTLRRDVQLLHRVQATNYPIRWSQANQLTDRLTVINRRRGATRWATDSLYLPSRIFSYFFSRACPDTLCNQFSQDESAAKAVNRANDRLAQDTVTSRHRMIKRNVGDVDCYTVGNATPFFTARCYACAVLHGHGPVSVSCLSVCLSQVGVLLKRLSRGSHKQNHKIAQGL